MTTPFPFTLGQTLTAAQLNAITTLPINDQTASYVALVGDVGKRIVMNVASANTVTINNSVFATGDTIFVANKGAGAATLTAGAGVTINSASGLVLVAHQSGQLVALSASSFIFVLSAGPAPGVAIFNETQASGTAGGTFTQGSFDKRTLNTTVVNNITGCSIAASVITLPVGTYHVTANSQGILCGPTQARLQNMTASTTIAIGTNQFANTTDGQATCLIETFFTLAAIATIELQSRCATTKESNGLGAACGFGNDEVFRSITITKVS